MKKLTALTHEFVEFLPDQLEDGMLYISIPYATVAHKCCCGCGNEVVTPLSPTDWKLIFNGETVSLDPSIGNWSFPCQSHYWIRNNGVRWDYQWSKAEVEAGRTRDQEAKQDYFGSTEPSSQTVREQSPASELQTPPKSLWQKLKWWK